MNQKAAAVLISLAAFMVALPVYGSPQFARQHELSCNSCHEIVPRLNENGLEFQASGYRLPAALQSSSAPSGKAGVPLAGWITARYEDKGSGGASDLLLPKVELISGGRLGDKWSYFVEWRVVSLSLNRDGSQGDRGGRFEDLFFEWQPSDRHALKFGQYRSVSQVDVSLRLSASEPSLFKNGLRTDTNSDPRVHALSTFSPSSRSPSLGYTFQSVRGSRASDGLFHSILVPFVGEFSIPLSDDASRAASFELGDPKGVFLESFYRKGHRTIGAHAFFEDDAWLVTALGTYDWRDLFVTAGIGLDDPGTGDQRTRSSLEIEYLFRSLDRTRFAAGLRVEDVSRDELGAVWVPYVAVAAPNKLYTMLLQLQYRSQDGADNLVADLSLLF